MQFQEVEEGEYRAYLGAIESSGLPGYTAAIVVVRSRGPACRREVYRDESVARGFRWGSAEAALAYAADCARRVIRRQAVAQAY